MATITMFDAVKLEGLGSFDVVCRPSMAGRKTATMCRKKIMLSPAMYQLLIHCENWSEYEQLIKNIKVQIIGQFNNQKALEVENVV